MVGAWSVLFLSLLHVSIHDPHKPGVIHIAPDSEATRIIAYCVGEIEKALSEEPPNRSGRIEFATRILAGVGCVAAGETLLAASAGDDVHVPDIASGALVAWCRNWDETPTAEEFKPSLLESLRSRKPWVRNTVLRSLAALDSSNWKLFASLLTDEDFFVRSEAVKILRKYPHPGAIAPLVKAMKHGDWDFGSMGGIGGGYSCPLNPPARALVRVGPPAVKALSEALRDSTWGERCIAAVALGEIGSRIALGTLFEALGDDKAYVRIAALNALDKIDPSWRSDSTIRRQMSHLVRALGSPDRRAKRSSARMLGAMKDPMAVEPLISALADADREMLIAINEALGKSRDQRAIPYLIPLLVSEDKGVCTTAHRALVSIDSSWCATAHARASISLLVDGLGARRGCSGKLVEAIAQIGEPGISLLTQALWSGGWAHGARDMTEALGRMGSKEAMSSLIALLIHPEANIQRISAGVLDRYYPEWSASPAAYEEEPSFIHALEGPSAFVRDGAARVLGAMGSVHAVPLLLAASKDDAHYLRGSAVQALGDIGDTRATKRLCKMLRKNRLAPRLGRFPGPFFLFSRREEPFAFIRRMAAEALGKIGDPHAYRSLRDALKDEKENGEVIAAAAGALGELGLKEAVEPLTEALGSRHAQVRAQAAVALGKIGDGRVFELLSQTLLDHDFIVRRAAVLAMGNMGDTTAVQALVDVLGDGDYRVREATAKVLGEIGGSRAVPPLIGLLKDRRRSVRASALGALTQITGEDFKWNTAAWEQWWKTR